MGLWEQLKKWLTSARPGGPRKAHPDLYPIDIDRIAKDLQLVEQAKRLGEAGLPAPDAVVISGPEAALVERVEKARQDFVDWGALRLNVLNTDLSRRDITKDVNQARQADQEFERKASALLSEHDAALRALGETARSRKEELEAFRSEHRLSREAHEPTIGWFLRYMILAALITIEGLLNARFFAQGLDTGLLGGFTEAVMMATVNVAIAFLLGKFFIPYFNHIHPVPKTFGILAIAGAIIWLGCAGLGIAHYRDSLVAEIPNPATAAWDTFLAHPQNLRDLFSWALFAISVTFGMGALFDGLYSNDRYPGYGAVSNRANSAIEEFESVLTDLREQLEELKNEELKSLAEALKRADAGVSMFKSLIESKQMAGSRLSNALLSADNALDALIKKFRSENELHRNGTPRPGYFDRQPDLRPVNPPSFDTAADEAALKEQRDLLSALLAEEQEIRGRIQAAFNQKFDRLMPLPSHFPSKEAT